MKIATSTPKHKVTLIGIGYPGIFIGCPLIGIGCLMNFRVLPGTSEGKYIALVAMLRQLRDGYQGNLSFFPY
jgi:hypothetical protein